MGRFNKFMKGNYKAFMKCPNCGYGSEIRIPRGTSVPDFVKGGSCKCDKCLVVFYPDDYTTEHFEKDKRQISNKGRSIKPKLSNKYKIAQVDKEKWDGNIKW